MKLNLIDIFSGVGGFTLGFRLQATRKGFEIAPRLLVDIDRSACNVCLRNMPDVNYLVADVHELSGAEIRRRAGMRSGETLHILLGGPPCQGFSFLGKRLLADPRNIHIVDFLRLVKELRPLVAVMENVPLMISSHGGAVIKEVCSSLSQLDYASCAEVLQANEYGVPQIRRRAFVIAYQRELGVSPSMPIRTHERIASSKDLSASASRIGFEVDKEPYVSVEDAIGDLPMLDAGDGDEVMRYANSDSSDFQRWARKGSIAVFNHRARSHSPKFLEKVSVIKEGRGNQQLPRRLKFSDNYFSQAYARLCRHALAHTITTSFANPGSGRFLHYRDLRSITVREAARLQSFPDAFIFDGDLTTQMRHVGNAVPPLLARVIRDHIAADILPKASTEEGSAASVREKHTCDEQRSKTMRAVPSKNTSAEILLRCAISKLGIRGFRTHSSRVPGCPDIVFSSSKIAIFVDGCFWHGCPKCYREPTANKTYWRMKVARNRDRDRKVNAECKAAGWKVLRFWEHEILRNCERIAKRIVKALKSKGKAKTRTAKTKLSKGRARSTRLSSRK